MNNQDKLSPSRRPRVQVSWSQARKGDTIRYKVGDTRYLATITKVGEFFIKTDDARRVRAEQVESITRPESQGSDLPASDFRVAYTLPSGIVHPEDEPERFIRLSKFEERSDAQGMADVLNRTVTSLGGQCVVWFAHRCRHEDGGFGVYCEWISHEGDIQTTSGELLDVLTDYYKKGA